MGRVKRQYEKPVFGRAPRFDFAPEVLDEAGKVVSCRSCSACHGCR